MDTEVQKAIQYAERLLGTAIDVVGAARVELDANWARDPKIVSLTLLSRSITNFRAAAILAQKGHVLEARILCRCLYENLLWMGALRERRFKFVQDMIDDEAFNRKALGELTLKISSRHGGDVSDENAMQLRDLIKGLAERFPKTQKLRADKIAGEGAVETSYVEYLRLSLDAVHCSVTALGRHLVGEQSEGRRVGLMITVEPKSEPKELVNTLLHLCRALMGVAVGTNEILGFTNVSGQLGALVDEFEKNGWTRMS